MEEYKEYFQQTEKLKVHHKKLAKDCTGIYLFYVLKNLNLSITNKYHGRTQGVFTLY